MRIRVISNPASSKSIWEVQVEGNTIAGFNGPTALLAAQAVVKALEENTYYSKNGNAFEYIMPYIYSGTL